MSNNLYMFRHGTKWQLAEVTVESLSVTKEVFFWELVLRRCGMFVEVGVDVGLMREGDWVAMEQQAADCYLMNNWVVQYVILGKCVHFAIVFVCSVQCYQVATNGFCLYFENIFIIYSIAVNIDENKPKFVKKVDEPKPEPVRVGDINKDTLSSGRKVFKIIDQF